MDRAGDVSLTPGHTTASVTQHAVLVSSCYRTSTAVCKLLLTPLRNLQRMLGMLAVVWVRQYSHNTPPGEGDLLPTWVI